jgi:hypothetical protein
MPQSRTLYVGLDVHICVGYNPKAPTWSLSMKRARVAIDSPAT